MEQNLNQHTLTFEQGLTSVPSDITSPDNTLSEADGIVYLDGEYKPLQNPKVTSIINNSYTLALVHLLNSGSKNYLFYSGDNTTGSASLIWSSNTLATNVYDVKSIGNTLIINTSTGLYYSLWNGSSYTDLGSKIPTPNVTFSLMYEKTVTTEFMYWPLGGRFPENKDESETTHFLIEFAEDKDNFTSVSNAIIGAYAELKNKISKAGGFALPFFARVALELYDGSYVMPCAPVLLCPSTTDNFRLRKEYDSTENGHFIEASMKYLSLYYTNSQSYDKWSDIVKNITVFITSGVNIYDLDKISSGITVSDTKNSKYLYGSDTTWTYVTSQYGYKTARTIKGILKKRSIDSINNDIESSSVFYKVANIGINTGSDVLKINDNILTNLTTQQTLVNSVSGDDFYSHCNVKPVGNTIYSFNRRLNIANVQRSFFSGFSQFGPYCDSSTYSVYVYIKTNTGTVRVQHAYINGDFGARSWFYYPDPRACAFSYGDTIYELKQHPGLNGAYFFGGIDGNKSRTHKTISSYSTDQWELLPNYLLQSEVDNPFTFFASGYVRVGQGTILGMAGLTTALSQDAYKISTTLVFTTQGIWALKINDTGQYSSVAPPFSREVCFYPKTITMTDNAVFFVSKKGLMCVTGESESSVVCVSKNLKDSSFVTYCNSSACRLAYDYKERLLYVMNIGSKDAYIYSISTGTWTYDSEVFSSCDDLISVVTDYPDTYIQEQDHSVHSFLLRPNRNNDSSRYSGHFTSRPLKLSGSLIPESIRRIKHLLHPDIKVFTSQADYNAAATTTPSMLLSIQGSNDLRSWSDPLASLRGKPYRFFKFKYTFKNFLATHTFAATILITQKRHTNRFI